MPSEINCNDIQINLHFYEACNLTHPYHTVITFYLQSYNRLYSLYTPDNSTVFFLVVLFAVPPLLYPQWSPAVNRSSHRCLHNIIDGSFSLSWRWVRMLSLKMDDDYIVDSQPRISSAPP